MKKTYITPELNEINLDTQVSVMLASEEKTTDNPPKNSDEEEDFGYDPNNPFG